MWLWRTLGAMCLVLGGAGLVLPVLPTTIFWIMAAVCFARSDPKVRDWIYDRPGIGPQVRLFIERGQMTGKGKRAALLGMVLATAIVVALFAGRAVVLLTALGLIGVGAIVVVSRKTGEVADL